MCLGSALSGKRTVLRNGVTAEGVEVLCGMGELRDLGRSR